MITVTTCVHVQFYSTEGVHFIDYFLHFSKLSSLLQTSDRSLISSPLAVDLYWPYWRFKVPDFTLSML